MSTKREAAYVGIHLQTSRFELFHHPLDCPHKLPICHEFEHLILGGRGLGIDVKAFNGNGWCVNTRQRSERRMRTHLLGQCIQVREGLEGIRLVCELLEQWRVLDGVDELVGDLRGQAPRRGREFMGDVALRGSILILVPQRPRYDEALGDVPHAECPEHVFTAVGLIGWLCQRVERGLGGRTVGSRVHAAGCDHGRRLLLDRLYSL